ncbi:hypothetical protein ASD8599_02553 [Ascidiaceihabitans donghaensis]|uniref:Response regulatory domain-containing protein n=1 Tax=Ascidiaceihabitans donghaensis TaxID=1510460 RepID=A0A2R8BFB8_9RHOB|nr:response regulator [Ascidiaceihabitans donghaensis]SPH21804.1 hypothetical protein ASD8599_02553 [Ascidiaceihabitans donghaensis]
MKCLIVEDDPQLCDILRALMEEMGHDAVCVHSIAAAMRKLACAKYELVVMEYQMPDGTTERLSDHVSMFCPNSRVIMITGNPVFIHGEHSVFTPGVDWLLRKPLPTRDLEALVSYAAKDVDHCPTAMMALP